MKYKIEKNTVQETLILPLYSRKLCSELYPSLYHDETSVRLIDQIDYDFSEAEKNSRSLMQRFGALEVAMRQNDLAWEVRDYLKKHSKAAVVNLGCGLDQKRFNIRNQLFLTFCLSLFIETLQSVFRKCQFSIKNRLPCHQTVRHKDLLQLSPTVSLHSAVRKQRSHLITVRSLFKKALRQCQIHKSLAVFSKHERHNLTDAASKLYITFGPLTKILATIHHRGQIGGHRKLR